ncbi:MAG: restriction endonuclease subunit S [Arcobacter sp.]|uniref:restriction endonuclease subunit S n=1 Tax=Arcobacter sp. TaxID=1872629 RepID=UPI003C70A2F1
MSSVLPQGWEEKELDNLLKLKYGKDHKKLDDGNIPVYGSGGIMRYANEYLYDKESILIPRKGTLSNMFFVNEPFWTVDTIFWSIINDELVDGKFLYYNLKTIDFANLNVGSAVPSLTTKVLNQVNIKYPSDINEQKRIADILSAFDDKIELNNQMNQTLEDMATELFKEWFENFNFPNSEGKAYKANGGEMKASELGEIPIDWEVKKLYDVSENISRRFKLKEYEEVVFVNTGDVLNGDFLHNNYKSTENLPGQAKKAIEIGDILYSEIRPKNRRFARVDQAVKNYVVSTKFMVIKRNENIGYNCLYIFLTLDSTIEEFNTIAESRSGTFPQITFDSISNIKIVLPNDNLVTDNFENIVEPIFEQIKLNKEQNQILKKQRDTLLPKLMSGEIRV